MAAQRREEIAKKEKLDVNWEFEEEASRNVNWDELALSGNVAHTSNPAQGDRADKQKNSVTFPSVRDGNEQLYLPAHW